MSWRRVSAEPFLEGTNDLMLGAVEGKRFDRRPSDGGDADQFIAGPAKMKIPLLLAWMEQPHGSSRPRVGCHDSRTFPERTIDARQCEILEHRLSARRLRLNVIKVKRRCLPELRETTEFATVSRPRHDPSAQT